MNPALRLTKWLAPAAALFALAGALLAPAEAGGARQRRPRSPNVPQRVGDEEPAEPAESTVRGRVVYDDTTRPVRRARIRLITNAGGRSEHAALTDMRGDFRIYGVPAGSYYAFVDVPGVLSPLGFVSIDELRGSSGTPDLGEGRKYFDLVGVDGRAPARRAIRARARSPRRRASTACWRCGARYTPAPTSRRSGAARPPRRASRCARARRAASRWTRPTTDRCRPGRGGVNDCAGRARAATIGRSGR